MTPYTDEWNKWRAAQRTKMLIERSKQRLLARHAGQLMLVPRQGDNFRFVRWGGLAELSLWQNREYKPTYHSRPMDDYDNEDS